MLDVSIALTSPYLVDYFNVQRRQEVVNLAGRVTTFIFLFQVVPGIVRPGDNNSLVREPDSQTQAKSLVITTRFPLRSASLDGAAVSWQPDLIVWNGDTFLVKSLRDSSNYGSGFVKADCETMEVIPSPPQPQGGLPFMISLQARAQYYTPTIVSPTLVTLPGAINPGNLQLFRNGVLITVQNNDYTFALVAGLLNITLTVPLAFGDFLLAFA